MKVTNHTYRHVLKNFYTNTCTRYNRQFLPQSHSITYSLPFSTSWVTSTPLCMKSPWAGATRIKCNQPPIAIRAFAAVAQPSAWVCSSVLLFLLLLPFSLFLFFSLSFSPWFIHRVTVVISLYSPSTIDSTAPGISRRHTYAAHDISIQRIDCNTSHQRQ